MLSKNSLSFRFSLLFLYIFFLFVLLFIFISFNPFFMNRLFLIVICANKWEHVFKYFVEKNTGYRCTWWKVKQRTRMHCSNRNNTKWIRWTFVTLCPPRATRTRSFWLHCKELSTIFNSLRCSTSTSHSHKSFVELNKMPSNCTEHISERDCSSNTMWKSASHEYNEGEIHK